ncbi:hypothetical protein [Nonomuraea sp. SYSU D8015]|uniref:hypothetical protein n=1 Tax=Nonomuraea sp. SYSU D8015 TaxID=2593644 RepID=UPI00166086A0|nr:hypothetical protein [Nonomuraea sp. SYSU D8015]
MLEMGDVVAVPLPLGGYGAFQVTAAGDHLTVCMLDWRSDAVPALDDLRAAGPLILDHHAWHGVPQVVNVTADDPLPDGFVRLGRLPVHPELPRECHGYGFWAALGPQVVLQRRWDTEIPAEVRAAYKAAGHGRVEVDLGSARLVRSTALVKLDLREHQGEIRWAGLDALPRLTTLSWAGPDRGLAEALSARPLLSTLTWTDPPEEVDLSRTHLTDLTLHGSAPRRLVLPAGLMKLDLLGEPPEEVVAAADGRWVRLTSRRGVPSGLRGVRALVLEVAGDVPDAALDGLAELESLRVRWTGPYGGLDGAGALPRLHTLELADAYGMDPSTLPAPGGSLRRLSVDGLRSSRSKAIKQRYQGSGVVVEVRGAKSDRWLTANIDNPLRDWVDDHKRGGAAACTAYTVAARAIGELSADDPGAVADARGILQRFVATLNGIDEQYSMIDTVRREEAGEVFHQLAERAGVPPVEIQAWFDEWRDF